LLISLFFDGRQRARSLEKLAYEQEGCNVF